MTRLAAHGRGQTVVLFTLGIVALLGAVALGVDVTVMYSNWAAMQKAVDSAALAGANFLPYSPATAQSTAVQYATLNGVLAEEVANVSVSPDDTQGTEIDYVRLRPHPAEFQLYFDA